MRFLPLFAPTWWSRRIGPPTMLPPIRPPVRRKIAVWPFVEVLKNLQKRLLFGATIPLIGRAA